MSAGKVLDARLYHKVQEWAKTTSGGVVTERDADAVVAWLRSLRGTDYPRKPAEGLRKQVLKVISQLRAPPPAAAPAAAPTPEWTIDARPDPRNLAPSPDGHAGQKRLSGESTASLLPSNCLLYTSPSPRDS